MLIELPYCLKQRWNRQTNRFIGQWPHQSQCFARGHRHRTHQAGGVVAAHCGQGRCHGGTGGQAIIHHDHHAMGNRHRWAQGAVALTPLLKDLQLPAFFGGDEAGCCTQRGSMGGERRVPTFIDGADGQFRLEGGTQFVDQHDIQFASQLLREHHAHGHGASRYGQHQWRLSFVGQQLLRQQLRRMHTVLEHGRSFALAAHSERNRAPCR
jgi:hypothetical protein